MGDSKKAINGTRYAAKQAAFSFSLKMSFYIVAQLWPNNINSKCAEDFPGFVAPLTSTTGFFQWYFALFSLINFHSKRINWRWLQGELGSDSRFSKTFDRR
jgi:hypothetical protein